MATLRIADLIDAGATEIGPLATAADADVESLKLVLRHLASKGLFVEPEPGRFELNDAARQLLGEEWRLPLDLEGIGGRMAHSWGTLLEAVRTGKPAYHQFFGRPYWNDLEAHPSVAESFDRFMGPEGHGTPDPEVLIDPKSWESVSCVVDVGGGTGALLAGILRARPNVRGILVDLPRTTARSTEVFQEAGVLDRVTICSQSFFDPLPDAGDLYLLKSVLCDWPDREARIILRRCAEAAAVRGGRVVILGGITPEDPPPPDLLMMVLVGGKNRSLREFGELAAEAGLRVDRAAPQTGGRFIVECVVA